MEASMVKTNQLSKRTNRERHCRRNKFSRELNPPTADPHFNTGKHLGAGAAGVGREVWDGIKLTWD
jgi:hypothetical protein